MDNTVLRTLSYYVMVILFSLYMLLGNDSRIKFFISFVLLGITFIMFLRLLVAYIDELREERELISHDRLKIMIEEILEEREKEE